MKILKAFALFMLSAPGKQRVRHWRNLRRLCMLRTGIKERKKPCHKE